VLEPSGSMRTSRTKWTAATSSAGVSAARSSPLAVIAATARLGGASARVLHQGGGSKSQQSSQLGSGSAAARVRPSGEPEAAAADSHEERRPLW